VDGRRGVCSEISLIHTGLPSNRGHNLYAGNVCNEYVVAGLGIGQTPDPETPYFISIPLDERTAIAIVGPHQRRSSMITSESGVPCT
jgi:hypothetical protein